MISRPRLRVICVATLGLAVLVVLFLTGNDTVRVTEVAHEPYDLTFGWPMGWVSQQSYLTPPLPWDIGMGNPMENPTDIHWLALAANVVGFWVLLLAVAVAPRVLNRRSSSERPRTGTNSDTNNTGRQAR